MDATSEVAARANGQRKKLRIVVEEHPEGFVAYSLKGTVVGEGDAFEDAVKDVSSAIHFHLETFSDDFADDEDSILDVSLTETEIAI